MASASLPSSSTRVTFFYESRRAGQTRDDRKTGSFTVRLVREWAPASYDRFLLLLRKRFYDDQYFVRAIPGFVLDFGYGPAAGTMNATKSKMNRTAPAGAEAEKIKKASAVGRGDDEQDQETDPPSLSSFYASDEQLPWFRPNVEDPATAHGKSRRRGKGRAVPMPNSAGTIAFGQEDDGTTKSEIFVNLADNSEKLDAVGFWPFGYVEEVAVDGVTTMLRSSRTSDGCKNSGAKSDAEGIKERLEPLLARVINFEYGDIFFADGASREKAHVRQRLLIAGGSEYIKKQYPGMTKIRNVQLHEGDGDKALAEEE